MLKVFYGLGETQIDVTEICRTKLSQDGVARIPAGDMSRSLHMPDPLLNVVKEITIQLPNGEVQRFNDSKCVLVDFRNGTVSSFDNDAQTAMRILKAHHQDIHLLGGTMNDEVPEQLMAVRYMTGSERVLEIGGNIGRNSLIISKILTDSSQLVILESDPEIANALTNNLRVNGSRAHVEPSALSLRPLVQQGWNTFVSEDLPPGFKRIKTLSVAQLRDKYKIAFDTLVIDCEGAFFYILLDMPEILEGVKLIIMENDYTDMTCKRSVDQTLANHNFFPDYNEAGGFGPCQPWFFQVWRRTI